MKPPDAPKGHIVAAAALGALVEARWQGGDLLSRGPADAAPDLLRGLAAEMAASPLGCDQVLSLALSAAAEALEAGRPPSDERLTFLQDPGRDEAARVTVRARVFGSVIVPSAEARGVVDELERRHRPECAGDAELSARLTADANLHELLWDDPRLPCDDRTRRVMLFSVPKLLERAEELASPRVRVASTRARAVTSRNGAPDRRERPELAFG